MSGSPTNSSASSQLPTHADILKVAPALINAVGLDLGDIATCDPQQFADRVQAAAKQRGNLRDKRQRTQSKGDKKAIHITYTKSEGLRKLRDYLQCALFWTRRGYEDIDPVSRAEFEREFGPNLVLRIRMIKARLVSQGMRDLPVAILGETVIQDAIRMGRRNLMPDCIIPILDERRLRGILEELECEILKADVDEDIEQSTATFPNDGQIGLQLHSGPKEIRSHISDADEQKPVKTSPKSDGPYPPLGFRWKGTEGSFTKSERRYYRLLQALWQTIRTFTPVGLKDLNKQLEDNGGSPLEEKTMINYVHKLSEILCVRFRFPAHVEVFRDTRNNLFVCWAEMPDITAASA